MLRYETNDLETEAQMTRIRRRWLIAGVLAPVLLLAATVVTAQAEAEAKRGSDANVLITVRMGKLEGDLRVPVKSYTLVVADGTPGSKLLAGERVPFPTSKGTLADKLDPDAEATASFAYRNIGFVTEIRAWILDKTTIKVMADIEDSRVRQSEDGKPPTVETRQLTVNAILTDGEPLELTRVEGVTDQSGFVEIEAKILR